jgi:hypothetical protein
MGGCSFEPVIQAVSATRKTKARSLGANCQQHCSAGVPVDDDVLL